MATDLHPTDVPDRSPLGAAAPRRADAFDPPTDQIGGGAKVMLWAGVTFGATLGLFHVVELFTALLRCW